MTARPPAFQFYPRDFVSDPAVLLMTPEERGGYVMLLCHAWIAAEPGVLPDDDRTLAILSGLGDRWLACRPALERAFDLTNGRWVQKRMVRERHAQKTRVGIASRVGRLGAKARWHKDKDADGNAEAMPKHGPASASAVKDLTESERPALSHSGPSPPPARAREAFDNKSLTAKDTPADERPVSLPPDADKPSRLVAEAQRQVAALNARKENHDAND
jgi:uncharacterized protein YdaU (DUF1376 family)